MPSFIEHRKRFSFKEVVKWDQKSKRKVHTKVWLKPETSLSKLNLVAQSSASSKLVDFRRGSNLADKLITRITMGRTPNNAQSISNLDFTGKH